MKVSKRRQARWQNIRAMIEIEKNMSVNPVFIEALNFCLDVMDGKNPDLSIMNARNYIIEIEERINYLIYQTIDILKTNALMECADIVREYAESLHEDYRID